MTDPDARSIHESTVPFDESRIGGVAVSCSDGRFGGQCDDFVQRVLGLASYDRLAVPGGPACLAGHFAAYRDADVLREQLEFLIDAHELRRVVLIAHQDCAFYTRRLERSPTGLAELQFADLAKAAQAVREVSSQVTVDAWFAHRRGAAVGFEQVPC